VIIFTLDKHFKPNSPYCYFSFMHLPHISVLNFEFTIVVYDCCGESRRGRVDQNVDCTFVALLSNTSSEASYQYHGSEYGEDLNT
jgi:hypothetical protein